MTLAEECGWWLPYRNTAVVSERPTEIHLLNKVLHKDGGPAIAYADGFAVWALNSVRVSREIAETPGNKLDARLLLKEANAEVRREVVRKIGIERVCSDLRAKELDASGDYSLLSLDMGDGRYRPYLKMRNPSSIGVHIEGVHPDCDSVEKALNWRNGTSEEPVVLT